MKWIVMVTVSLWSAAAWAHPATYEFALLSFPDGGIHWTNKTGAKGAEAKGSSTDLFVQLSGQDAKLAHSAQYQVLVLNGLSKSGWEVVHVGDSAGIQTYLLRRESSAGAAPALSQQGDLKGDEMRVPLIITGGHETDPRDHGRPVILIAAALNVPPEVFRETFTHVTPARGGQEPDPDQVRRNKRALMQGLGPYGVTDDRLNEVSNFYRYSASRGQMWRNTPAAAYATVRNGTVTEITITNPGAGYSSEPVVTVPGFEQVRLKATLAFGTDMQKNGSVCQIDVVAPAAE